MDKFCEDCIHNEVCQYYAIPPHKDRCNDKDTLDDLRPQGEWIGDTDLDNTCKCSECRMTFDTDRLKMVMCDGKYELPPCCPNCGAKMKHD